MANTPTREHREAACEVANGDKCRTWDDDRFIAGELPDPRSAWRINERIAQALADAEQRGFERGREAERAEVVRYPEASEKDEAMSETNRPECIHGIGLCTGSCQREPSKELLEAQAKVDAIARQVRELQAAKATQPPPESADPAPVATDTQAREACQQQAEREVVERWKGANGYNDLLQAYGAAIDERDRLRNTLQQAEREVAELKFDFTNACDVGRRLEVSLQGKDEVIAELRAERDRYRDKKRELEQREVSLRDDIAELSRELEDMRERRRVERVRASDAEIALTEERSRSAELSRQLEAAERALNDFESLACSGEWLSGSGGHRVFGGCNKPATWVETEGGAAACDEHLGQHVRRAAGDVETIAAKVAKKGKR